jgi:hypothetical protein
MICIFCFKERAPGKEHVFPLAIGGRLKTDRVCSDCNSKLGRVDAALVDFLPIRSRRAALQLTGNARQPPGLFEIFEGKSTLVGEGGKRIQTRFDTKTGKLVHKQIYHEAEIVGADGQVTRQITLDPSERDQIPIIIQRERKRKRLPPLSAEELAKAASNYEVRTIEKPVIQVEVPPVSFAYLRHAMFKIAYELAFLWLGESYLDDPLARELRASILIRDPAAMDAFFLGNMFYSYWTPHEAHHLAYAQMIPGRLLIGIRIFDLYSATLEVSREPRRYFETPADNKKLRFLAIDAVSGKSHESSFQEEIGRCVRMRRTPPFPDPLSLPIEDPYNE